MKKVYRMENVDCAFCAEKMERAIGKLEGVQSVSLNFLTQRLIIEYEGTDLERVMAQAQICVTKVDRHAKILGVRG